MTQSRKGRASRIAALYLRIRKLEGKFASVLALSHRKLQGKITDMANFRVFIVPLYSPECNNNDSREVDASEFVDKVLDTARDFGDVLVALSKRGLLSYKNCHVLRSIIDHYASDDQELKEEMRKYDEDLAGLALVTDMQDYVDAVSQQDEESEADPELFNVLSLKVGENVTECTLQYVKEVWDSLARRLEIPHSALLFERVADGCIEMTWITPSHLTNFIIRRVQENTEYFWDQRVLRVTIANRCIYEGEAPTPDNRNEKRYKVSITYWSGNILVVVNLLITPLTTYRLWCNSAMHSRQELTIHHIFSQILTMYNTQGINENRKVLHSVSSTSTMGRIPV